MEQGYGCGSLRSLCNQTPGGASRRALLRFIVKQGSYALRLLTRAAGIRPVFFQSADTLFYGMN